MHVTMLNDCGRRDGRSWRRRGGSESTDFQKFCASFCLTLSVFTFLLRHRSRWQEKDFLRFEWIHQRSNNDDDSLVVYIQSESRTENPTELSSFGRGEIQLFYSKSFFDERKPFLTELSMILCPSDQSKRQLRAFESIMDEQSQVSVINHLMVCWIGSHRTALEMEKSRILSEEDGFALVLTVLRETSKHVW